MNFCDELYRHRDGDNTAMRPLGLKHFLALDVPAREMLLAPILPTASISLLHAPTGVGKTLLSLSIGLAVSSGCPLLRWNAPKQHRVLVIDGEMNLVSLQERLRTISAGLGISIPNDDRFQILAADHTENGLSIDTEKGQREIEPLLKGIDLLILDNVSTLTRGNENTSEAWAPLQRWLLSLRRKNIAVLLIHHSGNSGKQRGSSKRLDALDTIIALRRSEDYSTEQGAKFEVHLEKLRHLVDDGNATQPFEASLTKNGWVHCDIRPTTATQIPKLESAKELFARGHSIRDVAQRLGLPKSTAWRLRSQAINGGLSQSQAMTTSQH